MLSTSFRKSFYLHGALHRTSKLVNFYHDLMQNSFVVNTYAQKVLFY